MLPPNFEESFQEFLSNPSQNLKYIQQKIYQASSEQLKAINAFLEERLLTLNQEKEQTSFLGKHVLSKRFKELETLLDHLNTLEETVNLTASQRSEGTLKLINLVESKLNTGEVAKQIHDSALFQVFLKKQMEKDAVKQSINSYFAANKVSLFKTYFKILRAKASPLHARPLTPNDVKDLENIKIGHQPKKESPPPAAPKPVEKPETHKAASKEETSSTSINEFVQSAYRLLASSSTHSLKQAAESIHHKTSSLSPSQKVMFKYDLINMLVEHPLEDVKIKASKQRLIDALVNTHITYKKATHPFSSTSAAVNAYYKRLNAILKEI